MNVLIENMKSNRTGEPVKNQMLVHVVEEEKSFSVFFSYETKIFTLETDNETGEKILTLGEKFGYSVTTAKYSKQALERVLGVPFDKKVLEREKPTILDIGFGTGTLTTKLYEKECEIYGQDFSERMIELAQKKMPDAHLYQGDFSKGLVESLLQHTYDFIIATYSLHHLTDDAKIQFIQLSARTAFTKT